MYSLLIMGSLLIIFGILNTIKHMKNKCGAYEIVQGKVIQLKESRGRSQNSMMRTRLYYTPIFEYMYNDKTYRVEHNVSLSYNNKPSSAYTIGQDVEIRVYRDNPNQGVKNTSIGVNGLLYGAIMCIVIGIVFITIFLLVR